MKQNIIIMLLAVLISLIGICFPVGNMCYLLLYGCGMVFLLSAVQAICLYGKITSSLQIEAGNIKKGQEANCKLVSVNRSRFINGQVSMCVSSPLLEKKGIRVIQQADAGETVESSVTFSTEYAGIYKVHSRGQMVSDIFGLVYLPTRKCADTWFVVNPVIHSVNSRLLQESLVRKNHPFDPSLSYEVRKYQTGDSMKRIHWKISAKERELYTRLEEGEDKPVMHVYVDAKQIPAKGVMYLEIRDKMIETAVSVIHGWYRAGYRVQVSWESEGIKVREVSNEYQWNQVYQEIAKLDFCGTLDMDEWCDCKQSECSNYIVHNPGFAFFTKVTGKDHVWVIGGTDNGTSARTVALFEKIQEL